jgi:hypothetical protein
VHPNQNFKTPTDFAHTRIIRHLSLEIIHKSTGNQSKTISKIKRMSQEDRKQQRTPLASELIAEMPTWHYKKPERNKSGGFASYITRNAGSVDRIFFQATAHEGELRCAAPFGISELFDKTKEPNNKRNLELSVRSPKLREFLSALDENTIDQAVRNYEEWFNSDKKRKPLTPEDIRGYYRPLLQEGPNDKEYDPLFRTKVNIADPKVLRVFVFDGMKDGCMMCRVGRLSDVSKFVEVVPIIEVVGLWFMTKQFGVSLQCSDVVVFPKASRPAGAFNFGDLQTVVVDGVADMDSDDIVPSEEAFVAASTKVPSAKSPPTSSSKSVPKPEFDGVVPIAE